MEAREAVLIVVEVTRIPDDLAGLVQHFSGLVLILHGGDEGAHLVGGAGGIGRAEGPVKEGVQFIGGDQVPVLIQGCQIIGGIAGAGQDLAGLALHDDDGGTLGIQAHMLAHFRIDLRVGNLLHPLGQRVLGDFLKGNIDGGFHVVAGNGLLAFDIGLGDDGAFLGNLVQTLAVDAVEVLLKGLLKTGLADVGIHGVALILVFGPVVVVHAAQVSQNVGGVGGMVFPDGGGFHHQARGVQLQKGGQVFTGNVGDENIAGQVGNAAKVKFITQADNRPGLFLGPGVGNFVAGAHFFNQQRGGNIRVPAAVHHVVLEVALPGGGIVAEGVLKGTFRGNRQVIQVIHPQLLALFQQPVQVFVPVIRGFDNKVVEDQVVGGTVAYQNLAVAVQNGAAGCPHRGNGGVEGGVVRVAVGLDDLQIKEPGGIQEHNKGEDTEQYPCPESGQSFHT